MIFRRRLHACPRSALDLIAIGVRDAVQIGHIESQNHVRFGDRRAGPIGLVQRMACREIHSPGLIDHRALQRFGQIDEARKARRRARRAVRDNHRILRRNQQARRFGHGAGIAHRRHFVGQLRNANLGIGRNRHSLANRRRPRARPAWSAASSPLCRRARRTRQNARAKWAGRPTS